MKRDKETLEKLILHNIVRLFASGDARTESEEKAILVSESGLFLTLGSGTFSARNKNLSALLNRNIPLISGKYGLRNHF